jgi:hypothetical protein
LCNGLSSAACSSLCCNIVNGSKIPDCGNIIYNIVICIIPTPGKEILFTLDVTFTVIPLDSSCGDTSTKEIKKNRDQTYKCSFTTLLKL